MMSRQISPEHETTDNLRRGTQHRCLNCNGIIAGLADQDRGIGLNVELGLVSDECAFICNWCTARLIKLRDAGRNVQRTAEVPMTRRPVEALESVQATKTIRCSSAR